MSIQPINVHQHLLVKLIEEASEVAQAASKALLFGLNHSGPDMASNLENLNSELADLQGVLEVCKIRGVGVEVCPLKVLAKIDKVGYYMEYSRTIGTLND
jgi:NTP pyrophosphatase (non-canonical NTP hydrolase)